MDIQLFRDILVILGISFFVLFAFHKLKLPAIVGFLLTGVMIGPHGLGLVDQVKVVENLAEIGVLFILFTIGIEFSLKKLIQIKKSVLLGGGIQIILTICSIFFIVKGLGLSSSKAIFVSFMVSLSSTVIVLKILQEKREVYSPQGKMILAILIFQDIIFIPMMLIIPMLAGSQEQILSAVMLFLLKCVGIVAFIFICSKWIISWVLSSVAKTRSRELFMLGIIVICIAIAYLSQSLEISLGMGGFIAGLIISETPFKHHAMSNIIPFRDIFTSFFFISVGMLFDIRFLLDHPVNIILVTLSVLVIKGIMGFTSAVSLGSTFRTGVLTGLSLSQIGEFSFVLLESGLIMGLVKHNDEIYQYILAVAILTMTLTPFIIIIAPYFATLLSKVPILKNKLKIQVSANDENKKLPLKDHLVIIGFGVNGRNLAHATVTYGIPYVVLEMNPDTVKDESKKGEPIIFGDASHEFILNHINIQSAKVVVIAISDQDAISRVVSSIRNLNQKVYIIARTRYNHEMLPLYNLGVDDVIPQEFETSIEIFARVMVKYLLPRNEIEDFIGKLREEHDMMHRSLSSQSTAYTNLKHHFPDLEICAVRINESSANVNKTLIEMDLRKKHSITVLAIKRNQDIMTNPKGSTRVLEGDVIVVMGKMQNINQLSKPSFKL